MFVMSMKENRRNTLALFFIIMKYLFTRQFSVLSRFYKVLLNLLYKKYKENSISDVSVYHIFVF
jgi:hypothetical protein